MGVTVDLDAHRQVIEVVREAEGAARALATRSLAMEQALVRRDYRAVHDIAEDVKRLAARLDELRRGLLVMGLTS